MAVNLSPVGGVAAQFFTNTGAVLTGGKLYTYAAGTTTPQTTFTSGNGATPWTNPIVLDAAGRVSGSGEIWLTDGVQYKFVLKDSNDVLIATYDNITGINSNFINFLAEQEIQTATAGQTVFTLTTTEYQPGTNTLSVFVDGVNQYGPGAQYAYTETSSTVVTFVSGLHVGASVKFTTTQTLSGGTLDSSQVVYDPPFTSSVSTNVEAKLAQYVSVLDFGADSTGATNSTTAFVNAIATGKTVFVPKGTYLISSITLTQNTTIVGESIDTVFIQGAGDLFNINQQLSLQMSELTLRNITTMGKLIYTTYTSDLTISRFHRVYFGAALNHIYTSVIPVNWQFTECFFTGSTGSSRYYSIGVTAYNEFSCYTKECDSGLYIKDRAQSVLISGSVFERNTTNGIELSAGNTSQVIQNVNIDTCYFELNGSQSISIKTTAASRVTAVKISSCYFDAITEVNNYHIDIVYFSGSSMSNFFFQSCSFIGTTAIAPDWPWICLHNNYNPVSQPTTSMTYVVTQPISEFGNAVGTVGTFGSVNVSSGTFTGGTPILLTAPQGSSFTFNIQAGNSTGNYVFQQWFISYGYAGTTQGIATKIVEQKSDSVSSPNCTVSINSSTGVVSAAVTGGSGFAGSFDVIGRI